MIQKLKLLMLSLSSIIVLAMPLAYGATASAISQPDITKDVCAGTQGTISGTGATACTGKVSDFDRFVSFALNILSIVVGIAAVIMIIVAGFRYITSSGKEENVKTAKNTILYAIIGLVVVALAQIIVHFVLTEAGNAGTGNQ
jgi:hypothetical protein